MLQIPVPINNPISGNLIFICTGYFITPINPSNITAVTTLIVTISIGVKPASVSFLTNIAIIPHNDALIAMNIMGMIFFNLTDKPFHISQKDNQSNI